MQNEIPFRQAWRIVGLAYNTMKKLRYLGELPFPVYERTLPGRTKKKLYCRIDEIEAWKAKSTSKVPGSVVRQNVA